MISVRRSVINHDVALKVVTNACDVCLVKVKAGHRDHFSKQLAKESKNVGLPSSAIASLQDICNMKFLFGIGRKKNMKYI